MNKIIVINKRAKFDYELIKKYEAGISLLGWEVKSIKSGAVDINNSFVSFDRENNLQWINGFVGYYEFDPEKMTAQTRRSRQLLLTKHEILRIKQKISEQGYTLIPTAIFLNRKGIIKLELYLAKGRTKSDKREIIKKRYNYKEIREYTNQ